MVVCHVCNYENLAGALICARCYSLLIDKASDLPSTTFMQEAVRIQNEPEIVMRRVVHTERLGTDDVALYINNADSPLVLQISHEAVLGRYTPNGQQQPRVDLSSFQAYEKGVSRIHAVVRRTTEGLMIEDLNSSNGTWLNEERLEPFTPKLIKCGDQVRLSKLDIDIYYQTKDSKVVTSPL